MMSITRLAKDDRGASIIELALVAPILASLLIGMVDLSRAYSHKLLLEQAAQRSIEKVQQYQATSSTYGTLQSEAATAAGVPASDVTVTYWLECNGAKQSNYDSSCPDGQAYGRWINVDIKGTFTPMFASQYFPKANSDGTYTIHGQAGLRTQ